MGSYIFSDADLPHARRTDPDTSHEAARELELGAKWGALLEFLVEHDRPRGWNAGELAVELEGKLGMNPWSRVSDLKELGLIELVVDADGVAVKRPGRSNRLQQVHRVSERGRALLGG